MPRPALEVADIFRDHGAAWREANRGHVSLGQLKVMSAIEHCRTAALGGHVARCEDCAHTTIAYNSFTLRSTFLEHLSDVAVIDMFVVTAMLMLDVTPWRNHGA